MRLNCLLISLFSAIPLLVGLITAYWLLSTAYCFSQVSTDLPVNKSNADNLFMNGNYRWALEQYKELLKEKPDEILYNFRIGQCIMQLDEDKTEAIPYLEKVVKLDPTNIYPYVELGKAYHFAERFDEALLYYEKYIKSSYAKKEIIKEVTRLIEITQNAKELIKYPLDVTFENLGDKINTPFPDYHPFIAEDESILIFTTKRGKKMENYDGYNTPDIYISYAKRGSWDKPKDIGTMINSAYSEQTAFLSPDGKYLLYYTDKFDYGIYEDVWLSERKGRSFQRGTDVTNVNTDGSETSASITQDGSMLFFASNRPGGYGGTDIYISKKLPTGEWGEPQNLGNKINTEYDEDYPHISKDGSTLYFCSKAHTTIGGFDIFKSEYVKQTEKWTTPENIGYPINTVNDDKTISFDATRRYAYVSAFRKEGYGNLDIYRVTFNAVEQRFSVIKGGFILGVDTLSREKDNLDLMPPIIISVYTADSNKLFGVYTPNKNTGKYIIILPTGKYRLTIEAKDEQIATEEIDVFGLGNFQGEIIKYFNLAKPEEQISPPTEE